MAFRCSITDKQEKIHTWPYGLSVGEGGYYGAVKHYYGMNHLRRSILNATEDEYKFRQMLQKSKYPIKCALEIGTFKGTGTALMAHYAKKVITIDKFNFVDKYAFWMEFDVYQKIFSYIIEDEEDKKKLIDTLDFDFAFIDGDHTEEGIRSDLACVKRCGRVLFHDYYDDEAQGIVPVVNELAKTDRVINNMPFAYWERPGWTDS